MPSANINPGFITGLPVSKGEMRQQFTNIKEAIAEREAFAVSQQVVNTNVNNTLLNHGGRIATLESTPPGSIPEDGRWRKLSSETRATTTSEMRCTLPDNYSRYRVELQGINPNAVASLLMRTSTDNVNFATGGYAGAAQEFNTASGVFFDPGGAAQLTLTGAAIAHAAGTHGEIEFGATRLLADFHTATVLNAGPAWTMRRGALAVPATARYIQFFFSGGALFGVGSTLTVMAHP